MFESLSNRLQDVFKTLRGETRLTPENVEAALAPEVGRSLREMLDRDRLDPGQRSLGAGTGRAEDPGQPGEARGLGEGQHAADRPQAPVEAELADRRVIVQALAGDLA